MKKNLLLLCSLLTVTLSAKEVSVAPAVKIEPTVETKEIKVAVKDSFKPSGSVTLSEEWIGSKYSDFPLSKSSRENRVFNRELDAGILAKLNFAPKHSLEFKGEMSDSYESNDPNGRYGRLRYTYLINDSTRARLGLRTGYNKTQEAELLFNTKLGGFYLEPAFLYSVKRVNDIKQPHRNTLSLKLGKAFSLPGGIDLDVSGKFSSKMGEHILKDEEQNWIELGIIGSKSIELYKNDKTTLTFDIEGGYDTYKVWTDKEGTTKRDHNQFRSFYLYVEPSLNVTYALTSSVDLLGSLYADYANEVEDEYKAQDWTTQPSIKLGIKAKF